MKDKLLRVLAARKALADSIDDLGNAWACDPKTRNRPLRQKLSTELVESCPRPMAFGELVYKIADECGIDL
jgi:hypothetical protein